MGVARASKSGALETHFVGVFDERYAPPEPVPPVPAHARSRGGAYRRGPVAQAGCSHPACKALKNSATSSSTW